MNYQVYIPSNGMASIFRVESERVTILTTRSKNKRDILISILKDFADKLVKTQLPDELLIDFGAHTIVKESDILKLLRKIVQTKPSTNLTDIIESSDPSLNVNKVSDEKLDSLIDKLHTKHSSS